MSGSEFAARNPRAVVESLERAARCTWRELQRQRKAVQGMRKRDLYEQSTFYSEWEQRARDEWWTLRMLLNIRRGIE